MRDEGSFFVVKLMKLWEYITCQSVSLRRGKEDCFVAQTMREAMMWLEDYFVRWVV
ncbi:MAG: hypothetical protein GH144_10765 [Clostridia bacterium]|nr:hypothetical protein [Clostridia bacterium]